MEASVPPADFYEGDGENRRKGKGVHAYCLYCETKRCVDIAASIEKRYGYRSFSPQIIQRKWKKGVPLEERHACLPGYIFVYTNEAVKPYFRVSGVIRCLGNDELIGRDLDFAMMLYRKGGVIGVIRLAEVGDRCTIDDPAWSDMQGKIVKLDRGRKRCCVEFEFDKVKRTVWVGYELVIAAPDQTEAPDSDRAEQNAE